MDRSEIKELSEQSGRAFGFVQKLYHEVSYMIREIESALADEEEKFVICRPGGYGITAATSKGLEPIYVNQWLLRRFSVCFASEENVQSVGGNTKTQFKDQLKILYLRVVMDDKDLPPTVFAGVLYDIHNKHAEWQKYENLIGHIEYQAQKVFHDVSRVEYEDRYAKFKGKFLYKELFEINSSEDVQKQIVRPAIQLYRTV